MANVRYGAGIVLILMGIFIPSPWLIELLRATPITGLQQGLRGELLLGAMLFKIGLAILGLVIIAIGKLSIWKSKSQAENPNFDPEKRLRITVLAGILIVASALRLYGLNEGLWYDEILTHVNYASAPFGEIVTTYDSQNQHFLYSILARASFLLFGASPWSLRLPAALFGVASTWALYLLGRQVTSTREALLSAAFLAFSYHHIWFSQNARGYTGLLFWTILASWLFVRGLNEERPKIWLLYAIVAALGTYTHISMVFVVMGHFFIYLVTLYARRNDIWHTRWYVLLSFCLAGFFTLQLYALVLPQILSDITVKGGAVMVWKNPLWTLTEFLKGLEMSFKGIIPAIAASLIFIGGLWSFAHKNPVMIGLLFIPALICAVISVGIGHHLWPRLFFFSIGFGVLIIIRGMMGFGHTLARVLGFRPHRPAFLGTAMCILLIIVSAASVPSAYAPKQDYLGALSFVEQNKKPGDAIVTVGLTTFPYREFYKTGWQQVESRGDLKSICSRSKRIWLLYTLPFHLEVEYPEIMATIKDDFKVVKRFHGTLNGGTIYVCLSELPASLIK